MDDSAPAGATTSTGPPIPIACAVDDRYVGPLCVLMQSLAETHDAGTGLRLTVIHRALSEESRARVRWHAARLGLPVELRATGRERPPYPVRGWVTQAVYDRLAVADVVTDVDVLLYLDADVLVVRHLGPLVGTGLDGAPLAAVRDPLNPVLERGRAIPGYRELGLPASREYFNSGVMLLDLPACRERGVFERCHRFLADLPQHVRFWDQDALNWAVDDDWRRLDRCWNTVPLSGLSRMPHWRHEAEHVLPLRQLIEDEATAAVLHFAGEHKPWNATYPPCRVRDLYRSLLGRVIEAEPDELPA